MAGLILAALAGCGDDKSDTIVLMASAAWNEDPATVADVGYHVLADVGWIDRAGTCAQIPKGLRVTVNDIQGTTIGDGGDCAFDALFDSHPFTTPDPVTVRLFDNDHLLAQATFAGMFWGAQARRVSPAGAQVHPGDQVVVSIPPGKGPPGLTFARWYWLDTAPTVPPFYTTSDAPVSADGTTLSAEVPALPGLAGHVALAFDYEVGDYATVTVCAGFSNCSMTATYALGPIALDVAAP